MKKLHFDYSMRITYSEDAGLCHFTIKCFPKEDSRQKVLGLSMKLEPECPFSHGCDSFGNAQVYGTIRFPHRDFLFQLSGDVEIGQILYEEKADMDQVAKYRYHHGLNSPGKALSAYFDSLPLAEIENPYEKAVYLMHRLHQDFSYESGSTDIKTSAEEAWVQGKGVCQDYSHIFIGLCQKAGIPARYVTGMIIGEGATHAWAEILYHGKWIGMDPTNDILVADQHIKLGHGRDAVDCQINRGIIRGGGMQTQEISVLVSEA